MSDILILGYYGFKNSGDDALLLSIIQQLRELKPDISLEVLSKNPQETEKIYNVKATSRDNIFSIINSMRKCRMFLLGGGTLIQDGTSTKSLVYYLAVIRIAQLFHKKIMLYSNGIGPLLEKNKKFTAKILNNTDVITLRDELSADELSKMNVTKPEIKITADSAFGLTYNNFANLANAYNKYKIPQNVPYFCVSVRNHEKLSPDFCKFIASACDYIAEKYHTYPVFLPFQKKNDTEITEKIRDIMRNYSSVFDTECDISELLTFMGGASVCIGMRLHSLIYSAICTVPLIGLVYDPKVLGFMKYIGQNCYLDAENLHQGELLSQIDYAFEHSDEIKKQLTLNKMQMLNKSRENAKIAINLLES